MLEARARLLHDRLLSLTTRVMEIRGLVLVDRDGLPLVSTLGSPGLEESLAAWGAVVVDQMDRARADFQMGPLYLLHLAGRDRQIFITPLTPEVTLLAIVEAGATASTVNLHLLGMCREILAVLQSDEEHGEIEGGNQS
jgi:predicted regulator of Ras-like GTPase activity (Roadblock/LC7/MglB family)